MNWRKVKTYIFANGLMTRVSQIRALVRDRLSCSTTRPSSYARRRRSEAGVALLLVLLVIAICSAIVLSTAFTTSQSMQTSSAIERSLQAEYLLKSAINLGRVLIQKDTSVNDSSVPPWKVFSQGSPDLGSILGTEGFKAQVFVEIRPDESKLRLTRLVPSSLTGKPDARFQDILIRFFRAPPLDFDNDNQEDQTGLFPGKVFMADELVSNLIDYMDPDDQSYDQPGYPKGIEGDPPPQQPGSESAVRSVSELFANRPIERISELQAIPGFTAKRVELLGRYLTVTGSSRVNVNLAPGIIIKALHDGIDDSMVEDLLLRREAPEGLLNTQNWQAEMRRIFTDAIFDEIQSYVTIETEWFTVIAKVDYGTALFYARAQLSRSAASELPVIQSLELF